MPYETRQAVVIPGGETAVQTVPSGERRRVYPVIDQLLTLGQGLVVQRLDRALVPVAEVAVRAGDPSSLAQLRAVDDFHIVLLVHNRSEGGPGNRLLLRTLPEAG